MGPRKSYKPVENSPEVKQLFKEAFAEHRQKKTLSELKWRAAALKEKGWRRDRVLDGYAKTVRYGDLRAQGFINDHEITRHFVDREDFLDFLEYNDKLLIRKLSERLAEDVLMLGEIRYGRQQNKGLRP